MAGPWRSDGRGSRFQRDQQRITDAQRSRVRQSQAIGSQQRFGGDIEAFGNRGRSVPGAHGVADAVLGCRQDRIIDGNDQLISRPDFSRSVLRQAIGSQNGGYADVEGFGNVE